MENEAKEQFSLGTEPIDRLMAQYSIPCIISLVVAALYNIVDQLFIANASYLGSYGNAANTAVFPLVVICLAIASLFGDGTNAYFTFCTGAGKREEGKECIGTSAVIIFLTGIFITIIYTLFANPILNAFGAGVNAETYRNAKEYLFWISLGFPFFMLGQCLSPIICGDGSPKRAMVNMLIGCVVNIIFDPILIYAARWGMMGAAIATIAGQIVCCVLNVRYLTRMKSVKMDLESLKPRFSALKYIVPLGMTSFFSQISIVLSMTVVNNMLNLYGAMDPIFGQEMYAHIPLAVVGIVFKFFQIIVSVSIGLAAGSVPIIGYNRGACKTERLLELMGLLLKAETVIGIIAFLIFEVFAKPISYLFGAANESIYYQDFAVTCIRLFLCMSILSCLNKGIMIFLQGMGEAIPSTAISVLREIVGGVGFPLLLPMLFGFDGILFFMPSAEIVTFIVAIYFILRTRKQLKSQLAVFEPENTISHAVGRLVPVQKNRR